MRGASGKKVDKNSTSPNLHIMDRYERLKGPQRIPVKVKEANRCPPSPHKNEKYRKFGPKSEELTAAFHLTQITPTSKCYHKEDRPRWWISGALTHLPSSLNVHRHVFLSLTLLVFLNIPLELDLCNMGIKWLEA